MFIIELIKSQRNKFIELLDGLSEEQLNIIPEGFNNNIAWNFGHMVVTIYALMYLRTQVNPTFQIPYVDKFKIGTKPEGNISLDEIENLKSLAIDSVSEIEADIQQGIFDKIVPFATKTYGVQMNFYQEILSCVAAHDGLHLGTAMAMAKNIKSFKP